MAKKLANVGKKKCPNCDAQFNSLLRHCVTCEHDLGFPNVNISQSNVEVEALNKRFKASQMAADVKGVRTEFDSFLDAISNKSNVVVSMPLIEARGFIQDHKKIYVNYEILVGSGIRQPAPIEDDTKRSKVASTFFATYAKEIRYGILSLDEKGLQSYGEAFLTLRNITIKSRVSFLEENTYFFYEKHYKKLIKNKIPPGFRSDWQNRGRLAAAKIGSLIKKGSNINDWRAILVSQGNNRANDSFIEAHIFGGFNVDSIESISMARAPRNDIEKLDMNVIIEQFDSVKSRRSTI